MEDFTIEVVSREQTGSSAARRYRSQGFIPSVVYSHGAKGLPILLPQKEFTRLAKLAKTSQIFSLKSSSPQLNGKSALVKEVQRDGLKGVLLHIDLQEISEFEEIEVNVVLRFVGEAPGVKLDGGILTVLRREVAVRCLPKAIPQELAVDISSLGIGDSLHMRDIQIPSGVTLAEETEETVVSVTAVHVVEEAAPTAAEGEAALAEGAAPAEGAAEGAAGTPPAEGGAEKKGKEAKEK